MPLMAVKRTRVDLAAARTILDGTYRTYMIMIANKSSSVVDVEFTDLDGTAEMTVVVPADDSRCCESKQLWDNGMKVGALSSDVIVTVAHSQDGV